MYIFNNPINWVIGLVTDEVSLIRLTCNWGMSCFSLTEFAKSNLSDHAESGIWANRAGLSYSNIADTHAKDNRGCYHSDAATATERQRSDLFVICARSFSHVPSGSSTELIVLTRCTNWSTLFVSTCVGISVCWFRAILQRRIISQSTRIVAYEWNRMQEGTMYLTRKAYKRFVVPQGSGRFPQG